METIYDWVTVAIFAGLVVLFLQRSADDQQDDNEPSIFAYLIAGIGCAVANYLGNQGSDLLAIIALIGTLAYIFYFLRPFKFGPPQP